MLVNRLGGLSLPRKSVVRLTDHPDMTLDVYRGRKTTKQQQQQPPCHKKLISIYDIDLIRCVQEAECGLRNKIQYGLSTKSIICGYE